MILKYDNKEIKIIECKTFYTRLIGFMFKKDITYGLLFNHCNSIHTYFMKENIDVIMLNKDNKIIYYYPNISKNKVILPKKEVTKTIELPVNYFNLKTNTYIDLKEES